MRLVTTTALLLALGSATASAGPAAIDAGLASVQQAPIEQVQWWGPGYYYGPGPYYGPAPYYYGPGPYYYGPAAVGAAVGGLVGGAVAGAAAAAAPAAVAPAPGVAVAAVPGEPVIDVAYCKRRFRSYDVRSQTFLGSDGVRHPCPN